MDFLNNLNCPQYINFESELNKNDTRKDLNVSPSCSSFRDDLASENMDTEDEKSFALPYDQSPCGKESAHSESYLNNVSESVMNYDESVESGASSYRTNDFPVNRPKNLLLPSNDRLHQQNSKGNKTTKVQPFHFMETKKRKRENGEMEYIPMAEQVIAFHKKTPERFHTTGSKSFEPMQHWSPHITHPKSPNLQAAKRMRGVDVPSREEQEQKVAEEMQQYKFHARPVNKKILHQPQFPKIGKRTPTKAQSFNLRTARRAVEVHATKKTEEKPYEFKARPVPKAVLDGPTGVREKLSLPVTQPKTPNFALKSRAEKWRSENKLNATTLESQNFKALPVPSSSAPFVVKHERKHIDVQPFSFDSKDKERFAKKEQKIMEEIEKENAVYVFKAQPMPSPSSVPLPAVDKKHPTIPKPFNFHLDGRLSNHSSFNSSMDKTCPVFKAQPATVLEKPPFVPEKSTKPPVEVKEFHLYTDVRASERQKLKEINDMKEREKELLLQQLKQIQEEEERREIERIRKEAVHKANPIRHYKPVDIKPSSKPPTEPVSPKFKTDERLKIRH